MKKKFLIKYCAVSLVMPMMLAEEEAVSIMAPTEPAAAAAPAQVQMPAAGEQVWQMVPGQDGISTSKDDNRGNWYKKQQISNQARELYDKIRDSWVLVDTITKDFIERRGAFNQKLAQFYEDHGIAGGTLEGQLEAKIKELEAEKLQGKLDAREQSILESLLDKIKELQALLKDIVSVREMDAALDKAMNVLLEQLALARSYEQHAWDSFDKISEVLNDQLADDLYREMQGASINLEALRQYFNREFSAYFNSLGQQIEQLMQNIKARSEQLKVKGVELIKQADDDKLKQETVAQPEVQKIEKKPTSSWWDYVMSPFVWIWHSISSIVSRFLGR